MHNPYDPPYSPAYEKATIPPSLSLAWTNGLDEGKIGKDKRSPIARAAHATHRYAGRPYATKEESHPLSPL